MKTFLVGILSIVLIALIAGALFRSTPAQPTTNSTIGATTTIATSTDTYSIQLAYPRFGIEKADSAVKAIVDKAVAEFTSMPPNPTPVPAKNELDGVYKMINTGPEIFSARLEIYQYTGGAHGGTTIYGLNYHKDGTPVTLEEALALTGKDLQAVSAIATAQLQERFGMVQFPEGATPTENNYFTFVVGTSTVTFIFQQYQVEAYAAGSPEIDIPRMK